MTGFGDILDVKKSGTVKTIDINGIEHTFNYFIGEVENIEYPKFECVTAVVTNKTNPWATGLHAHLIKTSDGYKIVSISHGRIDDYSKKGIPEAIVPILQEYLNAPIWSSTDCKNEVEKSYPSENRVPEAKAYWERIIKNTDLNSEYVKDRDMYCIK